MIHLLMLFMLFYKKMKRNEQAHGVYQVTITWAVLIRLLFLHDKRFKGFCKPIV
jgi:ABC-type uncharacterized transport system permease subunit